MRIAQLDLIRYGRFADRHYDFTASQTDLHVLYGANEAGKSTTLQAIGDLLFGFPHNKAQDWRFDAAQLRIGGVMEHEGHSFGAIRKRGTKQTLLAPDGLTPLDENGLIRCLGGVDRAAFERQWSLDHQRLRLGGDAMARFEDDLGQQLLAAGFGLENVQSVLDQLDAESGALWKKNGRGTRLNALRTRLTDARTRLTAAEKDSQRWTALNRESDEVTASLGQIQALLRETLAERSGLERLTRLRGDLERHAALTASLEAEPPPVFSPDDHTLFDEQLGRLVAAQQKADRLAELRESLISMRAACTPDLALLSHEATIDALERQERDLAPARRRWPEQEQKLADLDFSLRREGLRGEYEEILPALPTPEYLARLRPLALRHDMLIQREAETRTAHLAAEERLALAKSRAGAEETRPLSSLLIALQQAERRDGIDAELASLDREKQAAETSLAQSWRDLAPWQGTIDALQGMAIPDAPSLEAQSLLWRDLQSRDAALGEALDTVGHALARQNLARTHLEQRQIVSLGALKEARAQRDALFEAFAHDSRDRSARSAFIEARDHADHLADKRFDEAEESAKLTQIEQEIERLSLDRAHLVTQRDALGAETEKTTASWHEECANRALPALEPERLRGWLALRATALRNHDAVQQVIMRRTERAAQHSAALDILRNVLPDMPDFTLVSDALVWAQARRQTWQQEADRLARIRTDIEQEQRSLESELRKAQALHDEQAALKEEWSLQAGTDSSTTAIIPLQSAEAIDRLSGLHGAASEAARLHQTLKAQKDADNALGSAIAAFAKNLAGHEALSHLDSAACLDRLASLLRTARTDRDKAAAHDADLARNLTALNEAQNACDVLRQAFLAFARRMPDHEPATASVDAAMIEKLRVRITHEKARQAALDEKTALERRIALERDAPGLDQLQEQARTLTPDFVSLRLSELRSDYEAIERRREENLKRQGEIANDMRQIEQAHNARDAALDIETCRTEMANAAEAWASARIQSMILSHVARLQRDENTNPLLKSAESIFAALTCGRYRRLTIAEDGKAPELAAMLEDEKLIRPGAMSEGTRDQLFLSLRLAALDQAQARGITLPFIADDLFITFDEARAEAGFRTLAAQSQRNQILFLTHHAHLADMAASFGATRHSV
ncbi:YhaN family protein [Asaia bogorensis]|uniref:YhaN family protein n=1 Tax=Asaia bogorensis TaxID=91915 RepID=UPI000EFDB116|nr:YhaN family protein [Asaia bogorensis]